MANATTSPTDTPWTAEPSDDGFYRVVNSKGVVLAQKCVKEEADLFAASWELLALCEKEMRTNVALRATTIQYMKWQRVIDRAKGR